MISRDSVPLRSEIGFPFSFTVIRLVGAREFPGGCQIDISNVAIAKRVTNQNIFLTFCLKVPGNEVIVDVNRCCWVQLRPCIVLESFKLSHWNYLFVFIGCDYILIKLAKLVILLECLQYSLLGQN